jgi:hypothetical protein
LRSFLPQDVVAIGMRAASILQDEVNRNNLMSRRGDDAQVLIDLFHAVCHVSPMRDLNY